MIKKIYLDSYLCKFLDFCKQKYRGNLAAIGIYGSYAWGYFDKDKSDYDVFIFLKKSVKNKHRSFSKKFPKVSVNYLCDLDELKNLISEGHWTLYLTLMKSARMIFYSKDYKKFIKNLKKIDFLDNLNSFESIRRKANFDIDNIKKLKSYALIKYALPSIRSKLQLLTYLKTKKLFWDLKKVVKLNPKIINFEEENFIFGMDESVRKRKESFYDKKIIIGLLQKINKSVLERINQVS